LRIAVPSYITMVSSVRADLDLRRAATRADAFRAAQ
jgi:hypothetical protein